MSSDDRQTILTSGPFSLTTFEENIAKSLSTLALRPCFSSVTFDAPVACSPNAVFSCRMPIFFTFSASTR